MLRLDRIIFYESVNGKCQIIFFLLALFASMTFSSNCVASEHPKASDKIRLIVRSDDIGFCHAANLGHIDAYQNGILTVAEVIVTTPWFNEAVKMLNENPGLDVGVHLALTSEWDNYRWGPVLPVTKVPSLVDKDGCFFSRQIPHGNLGEIEMELRAQIELAMKKISNVTHLSPHMRTAIATPERKAIVEKLATEYGLALPGQMGEVIIGNIWAVPPEKKEVTLARILGELKPGLWCFVTHACLDTPESRAIAIKDSPTDCQQADGNT